MRVVRSTLLGAGGQYAVALELTNTGAQAQANFPVLIDVLDAKGRSVYRNDTTGIEPSIQQLALLPAHATEWWVDNEVLASGGPPAAVTAAVGASTRRGAAPPFRRSRPAASAPATASPGPHVSVTVENRSTVAQSELAVYAVALRAGKVVGAGRGVVPALAAGRQRTAGDPDGRLGGRKYDLADRRAHQHGLSAYPLAVARRAGWLPALAIIVAALVAGAQAPASARSSVASAPATA